VNGINGVVDDLPKGFSAMFGRCRALEVGERCDDVFHAEFRDERLDGLTHVFDIVDSQAPLKLRRF